MPLVNEIYCNHFSVMACVQVSLSAFAFLFSELVQYNQGKVENISDLEHRSNLSALAGLDAIERFPSTQHELCIASGS